MKTKSFKVYLVRGIAMINSIMENFFGLLKQEMYYGNTYYNFD
ncbi:MAG: IS3 family transposase [Firmicutes bacterium]|nr:IS3 family transposase [Bacillota bacterium]